MTQTSTLLYAIFALGGVAICLMLPRGGRSYRAAGGVLGAAAIASLFVLMSKRWLGGTENEAFFYLFAAVAIGAGRPGDHPSAGDLLGIVFRAGCTRCGRHVVAAAGGSFWRWRW